jgi:hypothetical protein
VTGALPLAERAGGEAAQLLEKERGREKPRAPRQGRERDRVPALDDQRSAPATAP